MIYFFFWVLKCTLLRDATVLITSYFSNYLQAISGKPNLSSITSYKVLIKVSLGIRLKVVSCCLLNLTQQRGLFSRFFFFSSKELNQFTPKWMLLQFQKRDSRTMNFFMFCTLFTCKQAPTQDRLVGRWFSRHYLFGFSTAVVKLLALRSAGFLFPRGGAGDF